MLAWSGWFLWQALRRWTYIGLHARSFGPFIHREDFPAYLRATDWQTPLMLAAAPGVAVALWGLLRWVTAWSHKPDA